MRVINSREHSPYLLRIGTEPKSRGCKDSPLTATPIPTLCASIQHLSKLECSRISNIHSREWSDSFYAPWYYTWERALKYFWLWLKEILGGGINYCSSLSAFLTLSKNSECWSCKQIFRNNPTARNFSANLCISLCVQELYTTISKSANSILMVWGCILASLFWKKMYIALEHKHNFDIQKKNKTTIKWKHIKTN